MPEIDEGISLRVSGDMLVEEPWGEPWIENKIVVELRGEPWIENKIVVELRGEHASGGVKGYKSILYCVAFI